MACTPDTAATTFTWLTTGMCGATSVPHLWDGATHAQNVNWILGGNVQGLASITVVDQQPTSLLDGIVSHGTFTISQVTATPEPSYVPTILVWAALSGYFGWRAKGAGHVVGHSDDALAVAGATQQHCASAERTAQHGELSTNLRMKTRGVAGSFRRSEK